MLGGLHLRELEYLPENFLRYSATGSDYPDKRGGMHGERGLDLEFCGTSVEICRFDVLEQTCLEMS